MKRACRFLLIAVFTVLLPACSTVRFVYDNAETYLRWRVDLYLDLEGAMADELDERIAAFMAWHRAQALPKYVQLTEEATRRFERRLEGELRWRVARFFLVGHQGNVPRLRRTDQTREAMALLRQRVDV